MGKRVLMGAAAAAFVASVWVANWLVQRYGPVRVWPTTLHAPAGVYVAGLAFLLRDAVQRLAGGRRGQLLVLLLVGVGALLSLVVSPVLAGASAAAFAASEVAGLLVFWGCGGTWRGPAGVACAVVAASAVAAAVDSWLFLRLAFHSEAFFAGQYVAKVSLVLLALPVVLLARRRYPAPAAVPV